MLTLSYVAGVTPGKWLRIWNERRPGTALEAVRTDEAVQLDALRDGSADIALVRLPVDSDGLDLIPLYAEVAVVAVPKDHPVAAFDDVTLADIADEPRIADAERLGPEMAMELVAAGAGILVVPHSIARLYARKDVVHRPVTDAPPTRIGLAWTTGAGSPDIEEFIGIVRGRTANSSRGGPTAAADAKAERKGDGKAARNSTKKDGGRTGSARGAGAGSGGRSSTRNATRRASRPRRGRG